MDTFKEFLVESCGFDRDDVDRLLDQEVEGYVVPCRVVVPKHVYHFDLPNMVPAPRDERSCATCERFKHWRDPQGRIVNQHRGDCDLAPINERITRVDMVCARWSGIGTVDPERDATGATQHLYDPSGTRKLR
jgi:hypothetical protein